MPPTVLGFDVSSEDGWSGSELLASLFKPVCQFTGSCLRPGAPRTKSSCSQIPLFVVQIASQDRLPRILNGNRLLRAGTSVGSCDYCDHPCVLS